MEEKNQAILDMIERYKVHVRAHGLEDELYKWNLIERFKGRPNVDAPDLLAEISEVNFGNLPYQMGIKGMKDLARERPEGYRACLRALFDTSVAIDQRIQAFFRDTLKLYREFVLDEKYGHYQDERMAGILLAFHDPDHYAIYKDSFYKKYCKLLGIAHKWKGEKYGHYQTLVKDLIGQYLQKDQELITLMAKTLPASTYQDPNHLLLAQNILYVVLDQGKGIELEDEQDEEFDSLTQENMNSPRIPLNQILYGPPGTGKTYNTINRAMEILGVTATDRTEMKRIFEEKLNAGQIAFVTFHQSMSYEDFVEGIKPTMIDGITTLNYVIEKGIFAKMAVNAALAFVNAAPSDQMQRATTFVSRYNEFVDSLEQELAEGKNPGIQTKNGANVIVTDVDKFHSITLRSSTSDKTYVIKRSNIEKLFDAFPKPELVQNFHQEFRKVANEAYTSACYAILLALRQGSTEKLVASDFKNLNIVEKITLVGRLTQQDYATTALPHILIIDEINRGNVSQIFGELITLIEEDKRAGKPEALSVTLPYSKDSFSVPPNLYIIGTMNTADRSVEALDTALRRRFEFVEMAPQPDLVPEKLDDASDVSPRNILRTINLRIEKLLDRDHQIGHAYFMGITDLAGLKNAFQHKLLPLLQEYFFGDYSKIGLVLGKGFVYKVEGFKKADEIFAPFESEYRSDLAQREVWHLHNIAAMDTEAFKSALFNLKAMPFPTE